VAQLKICPLAQSLFHRAIIQSEPWLAQSVAEMDEKANRMIDKALIMQGAAGNSKEARRVRMEMTDNELVNFLRDIPAADLVKAHMSGRINPPFSPVIEDGLVIPGHLHRVVELG